MSLYPTLTILNAYTSGTQSFGQEQVSVFDDVTGLPANGDNMVVQVQYNINGVVNVYPITVSGLTSPVYTGMLRDTATGYFTSFAILSYVEGAGIPPDPSADDLAITNVLTTPETAIGADDGTVTINATSSFPAITYSLDGVTYQSSNIFTGQISGAGTAYAKDTNSGLVSTPYTVALLGNILQSGPGIDLGNGNISNWNAVFNPIWFKYQRKDFEVTSVTENGDGNILVAVNADMSGVKTRSVISSPVFGVPTITSAGDFVYISTALYVGSFEVLDKTAGTLVLVCPFNGDDTTGWVNINSLRPQYNVQTQVSYVDPITGVFAAIASTNYPFPDGHTNVDLSSFLKSLLRIKDYSQYNLINYRDLQLSASYQIQYAEVWTGNTPQWAVIPRPFYVTFAAAQLQQIGGGNLQLFIPFPLGFQPAKWLCDFVMPVYSYSFPFDLSFIFSEYMVGLAPYYVVVLLDVNMNPLTDQSIPTGYLLNEDGSYVLNQDGSKFIIASQELEAGIVEHVGLNRLLINFSPPDLCWYFSVQIKYNPVSGSPYPLTQPIICRVADQGSVSLDRPVYLRWIGLNGSWQYYKFVYNQTLSVDVTDLVTMKNFVVDWQNTDTIVDIISKNAGKKMMVYSENMTINDINGIESIRYSPKCQIYVGMAISGNWWQTIIPDIGSFTTNETFIDAYSFNMAFALPDKNTQFQ